MNMLKSSSSGISFQSQPTPLLSRSGTSPTPRSKVHKSFLDMACPSTKWLKNHLVWIRPEQPLYAGNLGKVSTLLLRLGLHCHSNATSGLELYISRQFVRHNQEVCAKPVKERYSNEAIAAVEVLLSFHWACELQGDMEHLNSSTMISIPAPGSTYGYPDANFSDHDRQIRLLTLLPAMQDELIRCNLQRVKIEHIDRYEALSYAWGNPTFTPSQSMAFLSILERTFSKPSIIWDYLIPQGSCGLTLFVLISRISASETTKSSRWQIYTVERTKSLSG